MPKLLVLSMFPQILIVLKIDLKTHSKSIFNIGFTLLKTALHSKAMLNTSSHKNTLKYKRYVPPITHHTTYGYLSYISPSLINVDTIKDLGTQLDPTAFPHTYRPHFLPDCKDAGLNMNFNQKQCCWSWSGQTTTNNTATTTLQWYNQKLLLQL
jgi:hypothetical protein